MTIKSVPIAAACAALLTATPSLAGTITAGGSQTAGVAGRNASLSGQPVTLPAGCTIVSASGLNQGFWMQGTTRLLFDTMDSARGRAVPAGTYYVYPNLKPGTGTASVSVIFNCP
ncbi:MAG: hypothetical protein P8J20_13710 [Novosphingobium sp.]|nr:hypothetical protein [Novosphingobium sp.]